VAIVNDSVFASEALRRIVSGSARHQVAWLAASGLDALHNCREDQPDLILMDLMMPHMDGVEATRQIMLQCPCPVIIVTALLDQNLGKVFQCLGEGALDVLSLPALGMQDGGAGAGLGATPGLAASEAQSALLGKIDMVAQLLGKGGRGAARPLVSRAAGQTLVVIGASAGGPAALAAILEELPSDFGAPIIIVQHVDSQFASSMADWLNSHSNLPVRLAVEGDRPVAGQVLMAGTNNHLRFIDECILGYTVEPMVGSFRPSIDVFFESAVRFWGGSCVGVILTGMGRDGVAGLKLLRQAGALTIAQDCESSIVYGMPKGAFESGAAAEVLPLNRIAARLIEVVGVTAKRRPAPAATPVGQAPPAAA
jgi:two-component system response regulator WspF